MDLSKQSDRVGNIWTKAEGQGLKHGRDLQEELEKAGAFTLPDILKQKVTSCAKHPCVGTRKVLGKEETQQGGKTVEKLTLGDYEWKSYSEVLDEVVKVDAGLRALGFTRGKRIVILAETRAEWLICALGCLRRGVAIVTLYTSLNDDGIIHGIVETEVDTVVTSSSLVPRVSRLIAECKKVHNLVVFEDQLDIAGQTSLVPDHVTVIPYLSLLKDEDEREVLEDEKPRKEDVAILMYTSGSTGNPKAVEITHTNIFYSLVAYCMQANLGPGDCYIAYLPLAHIMELITEIAMMSLGVTIAYSSPHTLTNHSPKIAKGTLGDCQAAKPTAMTTVPLILDRVIKQVTQTVEKQGGIARWIFREAIRMKQSNGFSLTNKVLDMIVFNKVKAELGGHVRMMVVGGAPLSPQTHKMILAMFGCTLQEGYGCTETAACISSMQCTDTRAGHVGPPNPFVNLMLEDWEEGDYKTTDVPNPRGEIIVGGPMVAKGYFNNPEENEAAFFEKDGIKWFRTGDIGEIDETGVLYVIDRKKDLVKLKHGEYVSLGGIESKLKSHSLVENICVMADSNETNTVAIIVPSKDPYMKLCGELGTDKETSYADACLEKAGKDAFLKQLTEYGKKVGLSHWDIPRAIFLSPTPWTPDSGLVTAALKLRRKALQKEFGDKAQDMYDQLKQK